MPPLVPRKRYESPVSPRRPDSKRVRTANRGPTKTTSSRAKSTPTAEENRQYLQSFDDTSESSLSSLSESVPDKGPEPPNKQRKVETKAPLPNTKENGEITENSEDSESDSEVEEEEDDYDAWGAFAAAHVPVAPEEQAREPAADENMELTLDQAPQQSRVSLTKSDGKKKGPSKVERLIRTSAHQVHVQCLLVHNLRRNGWACDKDVQKTLVQSLSAGTKDEVERFKKACGDKIRSSDLPNGTSANGERRGKNKTKGSARSKTHKNQRDWGHNADSPKDGAPDLSEGDPTLRLLKHLCAFWRKRFDVTAPGFRKQGWKDAERLQEEMRSYEQNSQDIEEYGEQVASLKDFRKLAKQCQGSRDVGAQLFTALLRGLGLEVRLIASLQPVGFGWTKAEDADPPRKKTRPDLKAQQPVQEESGASDKKLPQKPVSKSQPVRKARFGGDKDQPINLSDSDSKLSDPPASDDSDSNSVIDITPAAPSKSRKRYDRDLAFPVYWTEVLSPITQTWIPVDPIVLSLVSNNPDTHHVFTPRGAKADRAKQVLAYAIAYSADGTAKDVTTRYLKNHMYPGKTKGVRLPPEKIPIYNRAGKVKRHETYDWLKHLMSPYARDSLHRTAADDIEDGRDLVPVQPTRSSAAPTGGEETLASYKSSAEFVLERHLRREEAIRPGAGPVRTFTTGKGDNTKTEPVYRRADVAACKTPESWHKEGRAVHDGEQPLKQVPMRAVTLQRKREIEEAERDMGGAKLQQGLYAREQTEWIIPSPIRDGVIPKNAFGNMDVYVPTMVPRGAVHIPLRGTVRVCRRLGVDFAEACTGFEFGNRMAVPVLTGVVVARENEDKVMEAWEEEEERRVKREEEKREKLALGMWRRLLAGMRVVERVRREYGDGIGVEERVRKAVRAEKGKSEKRERKKRDTGRPDKEDEFIDLGGGPAGSLTNSHDVGEGRFLPPEQTPPDAALDAGGGFILEDPSATDTKAAAATKDNLSSRAPISLSSLHQSTTATADDAAKSTTSDSETAANQELKASSPSDPHPDPARRESHRKSASSAKRTSGAEARRPAPRTARKPRTRGQKGGPEDGGGGTGTPTLTSTRARRSGGAAGGRAVVVDFSGSGSEGFDG